MKRRDLLLALSLAPAAPALRAQGDWRRVAVPLYTPAQAVRGVLAQSYLPRARGLAESAADLAAALAEGCSAGAREAWRAALRHWAGLEAVAFGPLLTRRSARRVDFQPVRPALLDKAIERAPQGEADMEQIGSAAKGFAALEAILWRARPDAAACRYALELARDIERESRALVEGFVDLQRAEDDVVAHLFGELLNQWIGGLDRLRLQGIVRPLLEGRQRHGRPPVFPRAASGSDAMERRARWQALRELVLFEGGVVPRPGQDRVPFETILRGRGLNPLADRLRAAALAADTALAPAEPDAGRLERAARRLASLRSLAEAELAPALDVRVGFSDADGD